MSVYSTLRHLAAEWRTAREEAHTRRVIDSLPAEIQKDIGWPDSHTIRLAARRRDRS
jgi:hypothetical protein